ncbi:hypothetical protein F8160_00105 [Bacillus sp. CH126_4D]|uniref:hypothetical protein n=1 Tax=unclassified Bacillus (in: firmicutes) TaxID=185979 RepID=UPI00124C0A5B|nr:MULTISPECIES: hypothetical protein [unclassified Bacillus (in: firmicutes)]KAB2460775.1 hypothetical protein F8162_00770 [Bacillus sp. CH140a_4T]KAB2476419.1 hypothetical protein F8160_00105 [Bacillus sp. CH126_4D]
MATKFFPEKLIFVPASGGHPKDAEYRIGIGPEQWDKPVRIKKVQMVYGNKIAGRVSPSFPVDSHDEDAVRLAMELINSGYGVNDPYKKTIVQVAPLENNQSISDLLEAQLDYIQDFYLELMPHLTVVDSEPKEPVHLRDNLYGFIFDISFSMKYEKN